MSWPERCISDSPYISRLSGSKTTGYENGLSVYEILYGGAGVCGGNGVVAVVGGMVVAERGVVTVVGGSGVRVGAGFPPKGACSPDRYWGFVISANTRTIKSPPATVRISPVSTNNTGSQRIKRIMFRHEIPGQERPPTFR
jgi:hypothetical protein